MSNEAQVNNTKDGKQDAWWTPLLKFFIHVFIGTLLFLLIASPAVGLDIVVKWLSAKDLSKIIIYGLKLAEYLLFFIDLILFAIFIIRKGKDTAKELWNIQTPPLSGK